MIPWGENLGLIYGHTLPISQHPSLWCKNKNPDKDSLIQGLCLDHASFLL